MESGSNLLLSTAPFYRFPLRTAFAHARESGFRGVEVMVTSDPATQDGESILALAEEFELTVAALHAPFLLMTRRVWSTDPIEKIYRATQVAESAAIPLIVVHPPYRWQTKYRRWVGSSLAEYSARSGVTIAVENMFPIKIRGDRGLRFHASQDFEDLDRFPQLALDTSHLAVARFDILEAYRRYKEKVVHFHLSNNAGKGWDSHLSVDEGVLPIGKLLETAAAEGFEGSLSLELDLRPYLGDGSSLRDVLIRNREFCEARLGVRA
ncbi:MAG TPA: sugar phosphate isomerase/epimerase family protein [Actinomycetota bacterium]|nr:sugar phosphate isomerase/epimerase family protein [Actinomycetota bacterium]